MATKPRSLTIPGSHANLSALWQLNLVTCLSGFSCQSFYLSLQSPGMTPGSVAPRTARSVRPVSQLQPDQPVEIYSFLIIFNMDLCSTLPSSPSHSWYFQRSLVILQALSLSQPKPPSSFQWPSRLSLSCQSHLLLTNQNYNSSMQCNCNKATCSSALNTYFHLYHSCLEPYHLHLLNLSSNTVHRHFNLVEPCDICPECARALHRLASVVQLLCF